MARLIVKDLPNEEVALDAKMTVEIVGGATVPQTGCCTDTYSGGDTLGSDGLSYLSGTPKDQKEPTGSYWDIFLGVGDTGWSIIK